VNGSRAGSPPAGWHATLAGLIVVGGLASYGTALALDEAERRGKQIFFEGTSPRGTDITAVVGDEAALLPGSAMPCSSCHGSDGRGRPEGGVLPVDVRWSELVKTYGHVHQNGRKHPPFDEASFVRSMVGGVDPANNQMDRSMPLYQMSEEDMADLVAYMKVLEHDIDPGVDEQRVQVATLLPLSGPSAGTGEAMARVMQGHFAKINSSGGIFGRRIELLAIPLGSSPEESLANVDSALASEGVFALVGAYSIGMDEALLDVLRDDNVPLVAPFTLDPGDAFLDSSAFYLYSGFDEQSRILADRALASGASTLTVVAVEGMRGERLVRAVKDQLRQAGSDVSVSYESYEAGALDAGKLGSSVEESGSEALIFLGGQADLQSLLGDLAGRGSLPGIYVLSSMMSRPLFDAPIEFDRKIFVAYPTLGSDVTSKGREEYQELAATYSLPNEHIQAQLAAFAAAKLMVEGLRRAGRDLSRIRFVESLEELYGFKTGVTPPLSYGPNRRIGALGAHVVAVDIANRRYARLENGWFELR
jgi:ABC-type branched-subunit amino acid transport system substrate-binding protein